MMFSWVTASSLPPRIRSQVSRSFFLRVRAIFPDGLGLIGLRLELLLNHHRVARSVLELGCHGGHDAVHLVVQQALIRANWLLTFSTSGCFGP